jgi:hypothetical protein
MGLLKKSKTTTVVEKEKFNFSKIVKFTYVETLAISDRVTTARRLTETEKTNLDDNGKIYDDRDTSVIGRKKTSVNESISIKDSGWSVTKVWNQPQFDIVRYAIGIKELTIAQFTYEEVSEFVSIPWSSPKEIIKVVVNTSEFIPPNFPPGTYIECYIKPTIEGSTWIRINPLGNPSVFTQDGNLVPRIVNFNIEKPISARVEDSYIYTEEPIKELLFKAILKRPDTLDGSEVSADSYSPILKSYRILMTPRNGL